jgi:hypothetical protein
MIRGEIVLDERVNWPVSLTAAAVLVLLGYLAYRAIQTAPEFEPPPTTVVYRPVDFWAASASIAAPPAMPGASRSPPLAAAIRPKDRAPSVPSDSPYRFIGKSTVGAETSIVLFGRGRIVTLRGPGPLDDEYVVEAMFDEYLVLRHVPTGVGKFLEYARRQQVVVPPQDPEESPRD